MSISYIDPDRFSSEVENSDNLVLVDFYATWCGPCKMMEPVIEEIDVECDYVEIFKLDIDEGPDVCRDYDVQAVPTMILFQDGEEVERFIGVTGKSQILNALRTYREDD